MSMKLDLSLTKQRGLSLIEIMISLGLGAFMLIGIISLMASVSATRSSLANTSDQIENGRYALQLLSDDISLAGFYGMYHPGVGVATYTLPDPCADASTITDLGFSSSPMAMPAPLVGYPASSTLPTCFAGAVSGSEALVVHRVATTPVTVSASTIATTNVPYLQIADCDSSAPYVLSTVWTALNLTRKNCSTLSQAWPYVVRSYFISPCEDCSGGGNGDGKPTLKVHEFSNGVLSTRALVAGVEDMHFSYGMDLDLNGSPDCYASDPTVDTAPAGCTGTWEADDWKNWANVVSVRVNLLLRGSATGGGDSAKTYDMGRSSRSAPFSDGYKRQVYSSVINVPNIGGVRESE